MRRTPSIWLALIAVVAGGCGSASSEASRCQGFHFDAALWHKPTATGGDRPTDRQRLADMVQRCKTLVGMTKPEVRALLGPHDRDSTRREWLYLLGRERGPFSVDHEHLVVTFGRDGRVKSVSKTVS